MVVDTEYIDEMFREFGTVSVRHMFGGTGLYADGVMFGLVSDGQVYLKADATTVPRFESEHCRPFRYSTKNGTRALISFWRLPDRLYDDPDELAQWARHALAAARQRASAKPVAMMMREKKKR